MICRPINEALAEEQHRKNEPNLRAFEELKNSRLNDRFENDTIKETIGNPLLLAMYEGDLIIGFVLLAYNDASSYLPEATRGRYGLVDWIETGNYGTRYNCAVEIYYGIINNFSGSGLWVFYGRDSFANGGFSSCFEIIGATADGEPIAMLRR